MALKPGARLGPFEITGPLGAGGMGEVYLARDTRLDRTVALKVLPSHLSDDAQLRQRFEREARAVSSLNHPHICTLHDVGEQDGVHFLVMEHLEGETLAKRLEKGALSQEEALRYAMEIADALDKAHRHGVVHRDLKPGNIMLTKDGAKLLDFGLAKSAEASPVGAGLTAAPTGTSPLTAQGTIVGTLQYMAPEQFEGSEADVRSDIFSFGAVLYEMITGKKAFEGKTQASVIAAIMRAEPQPVSDLVPMTPPALERLVLTCLEKDPDDRRQTIRGVLLDLRWIARGDGSETGRAAAARGGRVRLWMGSTVVLALGVAVLAWMLLAPRTSPQRRAVILSLTMPGHSGDATYFDEVALSPDGRAAAFVMHDADGGRSLWLRELDATRARPLPGTEAALYPFWSPDNRFVGFFADGKLKKVAVAGGPPQVLCPVAAPFGGTWNDDGVIVFGVGETDGIYKVPASGGAAEPVTRLGPNDEAHRWPAFLPDRKHFALLVDAERSEDHYLAIGSLDAADVTPLFNMISNVVFAPPDFLLFARSGSLIAQRFDLETLKPVGDAVALAENVVTIGTAGHRGEFSVSNSGVLSYRTANLDARLTWVDPSGKPLETVGETGRFRTLALSPDRSRVVYEKRDPDGRIGNIWALDLARGVQSRLTFHPGTVNTPTWSPDGDGIVYYSAHEEADGRIYGTKIASPSDESPVFPEGKDCFPESFSPDGRLLLATCAARGNEDLWIVPMGDPDQARQLTRSPFDETGARFSPDGRWISYASNESGRPEVYVEDFPAMAKRVLVSNGGGSRPEWRSDGKEIYYLDRLGRLNAVALTHGGNAGMQASRPTELFPLPGSAYAPDADGRRFLVDIPAEDRLQAPVTVVINWTSLLPGR